MGAKERDGNRLPFRDKLGDKGRRAGWDLTGTRSRITFPLNFFSITIFIAKFAVDNLLIEETSKHCG